MRRRDLLGLLVLSPLPLVLSASGCSSSSGRSAGAGEEVGSTSDALTLVCGASAGGAVQGYDVSVYQGNFDWASAKAQGRTFGYARISDGTGTIDNTFAGNWASMKAAGILRGAYQFFEPGEDEVAQANMMVQKVGRLGNGDLPAMIDVEATGGQAPATVAAKIQHWLQIVEAGTGKKPIIYTGAYFWQDHVGSTAFGGYPLWIAAYGPTCPSVPAGWSNWLIWQYSDGNGTLDHDVFNGPLSTLQGLAGGGGGGASFAKHFARTPMDVNGDGDADLCARSPAGVVCQVSNGTSFPTEIKGPDWSDAKGWTMPEYGTTVQFGDVNGDGKADVCGRAALGFVCELSDGNGFPTEIKETMWSDALGWSLPQYYATIQLADIDGDGKSDACGRGIAGIFCYLADGKGFPTEIKGPAWSDKNGWNAEQYYLTIHFADINGDGKADVCGRAPDGIHCFLSDGKGFPTEIKGPGWSDAGGWSKPEYGSTIHYADVNGDGKADVCARAADGVHCALSTGSAFDKEFAGPAWSDASGWAKPEHYATIQFADVNGDGKADVCARAADGMHCALSNGGAFPTEIKGPAWSDASGWSKPEYYATITTGDVNKDGKDDLCARSAAGVVCAPSTGDGFGATFDGPKWSDASGWTAESNYASVRLLGVAHAQATNPGSGDPSGSPGGAKPGAAPGGTNPADTPTSPDAPSSSSGCAASPARPGTGSAPLALLFTLLALITRRRSS